MMEQIVRKQALIVVREVDDDGVYDIDISTESVDIEGDIIEVGGWQLGRFLRNPVVLWAHDYRSVPIGRALEVVKEPPVLRAQFVFREPANDHDPVLPIKAAWDQGILRAASVGFWPIASEPVDPDSDGPLSPRRYIEQELLEFSIVPIPANEDALRRAFERVVKGLPSPELPLAAEAAAKMSGEFRTDNTDDTELSGEELAALKSKLDQLKQILGV